MSLGECYPEPSERAVLKMQRVLDGHMKHFIALSPFCPKGGWASAVTAGGSHNGQSVNLGPL